MSVGRRVRRWRVAKGLSERAAAKKAGVSQAIWHRIERDDMKRIGLEIAFRIVDACEGLLTIEDMRPRERRSAA